jgi:hypothetical protein
MTQNDAGVAAAEAAGAGAGARQQNPTLLRAVWRRTGMGGITYPIALRLEGGRLSIVEPLREEYSRSHSHGTWYYASQIDILLYLEQSNSGKRSVHVALCRLEPQQCKAVEAAAWSAWVVKNLTIRQVEKRLRDLVLAYG